MMPNPNPGWGSPWIPSACQLGYGWGVNNVISYPMVNSQPPPPPPPTQTRPVLAGNAIWNASQWQQWNTMPLNWGHPTVLDSRQAPPPPPPPVQAPPISQAPPPPPKEDLVPSIEISKEEKQFDIQFAEWESKFNAWREENKNHPDKKALAEYETQWEGWRQQLLHKREQMRKQREEANKQLTDQSYQLSGHFATPSSNLFQSSYTSEQLQPQQSNLLSSNDGSKALEQNSLIQITQIPPTQDKIAANEEIEVNQLLHLHSKPNCDLKTRKYDNDQIGNQPRDSVLQKASRINPYVDLNFKSTDQLIQPDPFHNNRGFANSVPKSYNVSHKSSGNEKDDSHVNNSGSNNIPDWKLPFQNSNPNFDSQMRSRNLSPNRWQQSGQGKLRRDFPSKSVYNNTDNSSDPVLHSRQESNFGTRTFHYDPQHRKEMSFDKKCNEPTVPFPNDPSHATGSVTDHYENFTPIVKDYCNESSGAALFEPIVYEYHHRPGRFGKYGSTSEIISVDYGHGSSGNRTKSIEAWQPPPSKDDLKVNLGWESAKSTVATTVPLDNPAPIGIKPASTQLFPSAAAIQNSLKTESSDSVKVESETSVEIIKVEDLLLAPGRHGRPSKLVVILRGLPGSGKSHVARLLKEKEIAMGGSPPRILSIDDYYSLDDSGSAWDMDQEEQYRQNLVKSLKRNLDDGHFPFIIVDCICLKSDHILDMSGPARMRGFTTYLIEMPRSDRTSTTRRCTKEDVEMIEKNYEVISTSIPRLNIHWLLQDVADTQGPSQSSPDNIVTSTTTLLDDDSQNSSSWDPQVSKWELMEQTEEKLDRLDGIVKRKLEKPASLEDWLQLPDDYDQRKSSDGKKRVRWADIEEKLQQEKMRAVGFVVGQTDWSRMTDPTFGESALTKTKYI